MTAHSSPLSKLALAACAFGSLVATSGLAEAGHFGGHGGGGGGFHGSFHGSVHVGGGGFHGGVSVSAHYARPAFHGGYYGGRGGYYGGGYYGVHGGVHVGWGYYPRYYYPYWYGEAVPSYYSGSYYPVAPVAAYAPAAVLPQPELPRFGVGVFGGGVNVTDSAGNSKPDSSDVGLLARYRLTPGLILEGDIGKTSYQNNERVDRRMGGALLYEFGAYNHFAPYVLAGLGVQQAQVGGTYSTTQDFGELGVGLRYAFSPHLAITADIRAGSRASVSNDTTANTLTGTQRSVAPPTSASGNSEDYTRGQVAAIIYF